MTATTGMTGTAGMTGYDVDVDALAAVVAAMETCSRALAEQAAVLDASLHRLHEDWSGMAGDAHARSHARWRSSFEEMATSLAGLRSMGDAARAAYSATIQANLAMWRQVG